MDNDYCEDCRANGDDYYTNEDGETVCACYLCCFADEMDDYEGDCVDDPD